MADHVPITTHVYAGQRDLGMVEVAFYDRDTSEFDGRSSFVWLTTDEASTLRDQLSQALGTETN